MTEQHHLPPPSELKGYLTFLYHIILDARILGYQEAPHNQIADLMDAIHNLPHFLTHWNDFDQELFRNFLVGYDKKWGGNLVTRLENCLKHDHSS